MSKKITIGTMLLLLLLAVLITFNITYLAVNNKYSDRLQEILADYNIFEKLSGVMQIVDEHYIGKADPDAANDAILAGYIAGIGDLYARYMSTEAYAEFLAEQSGSKVGIGMLASYDSEKEAILVTMVMPDSPAEKAGILPGDLLIAIDDAAVADIPYSEAAALLKGEEGTSVALSVIRDNVRQMDFTVTRAPVTLLTVTSRICVDKEGAQTDIGYVHISGFDSQTPAQFTTALASLRAQGAKSFIFDLRGNPGGELNSVIKVIDSLVPEGPIVHIVDRDGKAETTDSDENCIKEKVCVLVDSQTASAAELFTAALMDYTDKEKFDATVIGTKTYGKGTVQSVFRLSDDSAISISTKTYNPPYSENYEGKGLSPDVNLPLNDEAASVSIYLRDHAIDNQIVRAVEILSQS